MKIPLKIIAFHLLNDRSGSPKVLSQLLKFWGINGYQVELYTNANQNGFLHQIKHVRTHHGWYKFKANVFLRLIYYTISQVWLIINMWNKVNKGDIVYINTVLPFGAAILGKCKGARIIYHIHETTINPSILKWFLFKIVALSAHDIINVSKYVELSHQISSAKNHLVYNSIEDEFISNLLPKHLHNRQPSNVLMVCSLKKYKGITEYLNLANAHPDYNFKLVLNASDAELKSYFNQISIPQNLRLFSSQTNLHPFYQWADIIVNLSRPDEWVETFGLTIIEGMAYGLPAIVPPVGGILEVIENGVTGFAVDSRNSNLLNQTLLTILSSKDNFLKMSLAAKARLDIFRELKMYQSIHKIL